MIDLQYADDISWITNNSEQVTEIEEAPSKLGEKNLHVNDTKTERHDIERNAHTDWMKCNSWGVFVTQSMTSNKGRGLPWVPIMISNTY